MSLKQKIMDKLQQEGSQMDPSEYNNLFLDEMQIEKLSSEDKDFLAGFTSMETLSFNLCKLTSLENLPELKSLRRLELAENKIGGEHLPHLAKYADTLVTLKMAQNNIGSLDDLEHLKALKALKNVDLEGNEVCKLSDYKSKVFAMLPNLQSLDGYNRIGEEVASESEDDYGAYGEEGEDDLDEEFIKEQFTEEQLKTMAEQGIDPKDVLAGQFDMEGGEDDLYGEEGEDDYGSEDPEEEGAGEKRQKK